MLEQNSTTSMIVYIVVPAIKKNYIGGLILLQNMCLTVKPEDDFATNDMFKLADETPS